MKAEDNPDRSNQYRDTNPEKLLDQLNENFRQLRLLRTAIQDREETIQLLHKAVHRRDEIVEDLQKKIKLSNRLRPLLYSLIGGVLIEIVHFVMEWSFAGHLPH